jgi:hypothetical protein
VALKFDPHFRRQIISMAFEMLLDFVPDRLRFCGYPVDEPAPD